MDVQQDHGAPHAFVFVERHSCAPEELSVIVKAEPVPTASLQSLASDKDVYEDAVPVTGTLYVC